MLATLLLLLWSALVTPSIQMASPEGDRLLIFFEAGATSACTVYELQTPEPYAPRHCWILEEGLTNYEDDWAYILKENKDWKVYAEVYYTDPMTGRVVTRMSNVLVMYR